MRMVRVLLLVGIASASLLGGCDKKVKLTFTNFTNQSREIQLAGPGVDHSYVGIAAATGGKARYSLKVKKDRLPAIYHWRAGDISSRFTVTEDTPGQVWVDIKQEGSGGLRDEHTEVHEEKKFEAKDIIIHQDTVVE